ncbi:MAG: DUF302 domain-containing protein [bacterium]|nr:DUF302 domain-containing protein [bacterium]
MTTPDYAITKQFKGSFQEALSRITASLKEQGFGILTAVDVQQTLAEKLNVEFGRYRILGACNPPNAYKALQAEIEIGLLLPCNVIVFDRNGGIYISVIRPTRALTLSANSALQEIAKEIETKLIKALETAVN